ncbi:CobQ/CobB/MinD/ParA nucleotide binding domain-containing protein [Ectothiorhodospira mobilis]|uniref:CobQ/CobB/MinD/ParA nucleotide binding domain-containing protein n=1 Tax=Ectothiorhodospira mobilis TaxID=195064 RepID=A0A1I4REL5_ECTMO|nr:ParA family protein [Ectothiorhodospira mobilis]SFM50380.1 CobQ/CobB/MinD/ParA nucleotide binding domain-containing protein [Ectothiorhodospira mobilis]
MQERQRVTFDGCIPRMVASVLEVCPEADFSRMRVVRDMHGRLYLVVPDDWSDEALVAVRQRLRETLGPYSPGEDSGVGRCSDTLAGEALFWEPSLMYWVEDTGVQVVERRAMGQDWVHQPESEREAHCPRLVFHSLKGGVGRSTAMMLWGRELVRQGRTVLLVDLDLEAPGLGAHMLPVDSRPDYGVLDWLVEDLVGNAGPDLMREMVAESPLAESPGLWVAPAVGRRTMDHPDNVLAKLARAYLEGEDGNGFAARLRRMIAELEAQVRPEVVLIDSRAGLHETVAATLLHLQAEVFFFAVDVPATWEGYRYLFGHLSRLASVHEGPWGGGDWRQRFHMVQARSGMREADKRRFASNAYGVWVDTLYDELPPISESAEEDELSPATPPGKEEWAFTFDEQDPEGPHWPLAILRSDHFEAFNPMEQLAEVGEHAIREAFGEFFQGLEAVLSLQEDANR